MLMIYQVSYNFKNRHKEIKTTYVTDEENHPLNRNWLINLILIEAYPYRKHKKKRWQVIPLIINHLNALTVDSTINIFDNMNKLIVVIKRIN